jgi:hypothetical protein
MRRSLFCARKGKRVTDPKPPPEVATSKMGIACVGLLILLVIGIIALAATASAV